MILLLSVMGITSCKPYTAALSFDICQVLITFPQDSTQQKLLTGAQENTPASRQG
jgi:hypothetical protein